MYKFGSSKYKFESIQYKFGSRKYKFEVGCTNAEVEYMYIFGSRK